jgi:hypothetical protein
MHVVPHLVNAHHLSSDGRHHKLGGVKVALQQAGVLQRREGRRDSSGSSSSSVKQAVDQPSLHYGMLISHHFTKAFC